MRQEDDKFKVILGYIGRWKPTRDDWRITGDTAGRVHA